LIIQRAAKADDLVVAFVGFQPREQRAMGGSAHRFLELFYFDAGGGHRSATTALREIMAQRFPHWRVDVVDLQELLQPVDPIFRLTRVQSQNVYNRLLKRDWTYGSHMMLRGLQTGIRTLAADMEALLRQHWRYEAPDLVVSLIPNFNRVMFRALASVHPDIPFVTVMTDLADYPPHFWLERQDQHIICGSKKAVRQARSMGHRPERIFEVSGMILRPAFYINNGTDRRQERQKLGLDPDLPTALIMFGGNGSKRSTKMVKRLEESGLGVQSIVMCGHNHDLKLKLEGRKACRPIGFTEQVPYYMRLADFFIGKPGPGCISEALCSGLPVIVERNKRTMPQERYNTKWVERREVGVVVKSFKQIAKAVRSLLDDNTLEQYRQNVRRVSNLAVFEIPGIFASIMNSNSPSGGFPSHLVGPPPPRLPIAVEPDQSDHYHGRHTIG
jgi:UDP-N-acetylglucosamine:LPS N-acetylglucosamine transferase